MSTGWLRDLAPPGKWYVEKDEPWRVRTADGYPIAFCGTLPGRPDPNPVRAERHASLIALAPELAVLLADAIDALDSRQGALDPDFPDREIEALLARFADLQHKQPA